jgi:hypothetical protein
MRNDFITEITPATRGIWTPGVFAAEHVPTGRRYYVGTANVGQRLRDNLNWLKLGVHHNEALQSAFSAAAPHEFRFVLVERTGVSELVRMLKQAWLDRDRRDDPLGAFNSKNALPAKRTDLPPLFDLALPPDFLYEPPPVAPEGILERIERVLERPFAVDREPLSPAERRERAEQLIRRVQRVVDHNWETLP